MRRGLGLGGLGISGPEGGQPARRQRRADVLESLGEVGAVGMPGVAGSGGRAGASLSGLGLGTKGGSSALGQGTTSAADREAMRQWLSGDCSAAVAGTESLVPAEEKQGEKEKDLSADGHPSSRGGEVVDKSSSPTPEASIEPEVKQQAEGAADLEKGNTPARMTQRM